MGRQESPSFKGFSSQLKQAAPFRSRTLVSLWARSARGSRTRVRSASASGSTCLANSSPLTNPGATFGSPSLAVELLRLSGGQSSTSWSACSRSRSRRSFAPPHSTLGGGGGVNVVSVGSGWGSTTGGSELAAAAARSSRTATSGCPTSPEGVLAARSPAGGVVSIPASSAADFDPFGSWGAFAVHGRNAWTTHS